MGYTTGRRLTNEFLHEIARKYKSRGEFQKHDPSAYSTCRRRNLLSSVTRHMSNVSFSIPQLLCRQLLGRLLNKHSLYNTRKIIPPYELDIYYPELNLAIEYNGHGWHFDETTKQRDKKKALLIEEKQIAFVVLIENSRDYEEDIKNQLASNPIIQKYINPESILRCKINWDDIYDQTTIAANTKRIKHIIDNCDSVKQFRNMFRAEYNFVLRYKLHYLMKHLRRERIKHTVDDLLDIAMKYEDYSEFIKTRYYPICHKRGLLKLATAHMSRKKSTWKNIEDDALIQMVMASGAKYPSDLKASHPKLCNEIKRRKLNVWNNQLRKVRNNPHNIKCQFDNLIAQGLNKNFIKKNYPALYASYRYYTKKGLIEDTHGKKRKVHSHIARNMYEN